MSALELAITDIRAQAAGKPVHALLGKQLRDKVRVYANVNRCITDRSVKGYADTAREMAGRGFTAIKISPFDGVMPDQLDEPAVKMVVTWGLSDRHSWIVRRETYQAKWRTDDAASRPLPFAADLEAKPAFDAIARAFANAPQRKAG